MVLLYTKIVSWSGCFLGDGEDQGIESNRLFQNYKAFKTNKNGMLLPIGGGMTYRLQQNFPLDPRV